MSRISKVEPQSASADIQQLYEHRLRGKPGNVHKVMAHQPQALTAFLAFYATVGKSFGQRLYELIYIRVSMLNRCNYCLQHHLKSSGKAGLTQQDWAVLKSGSYEGFNDAEKAALGVAEKLTRSPWEITDADFDGLKKHFNEAQIVDLDLLVGLANLTNRFTDPMGLELEFPAETV